MWLVQCWWFLHVSLGECSNQRFHTYPPRWFLSCRKWRAPETDEQKEAKQRKKEEAKRRKKDKDKEKKDKETKEEKPDDWLEVSGFSFVAIHEPVVWVELVIV